MSNRVRRVSGERLALKDAIVRALAEYLCPEADRIGAAVCILIDALPDTGLDPGGAAVEVSWENPALGFPSVEVTVRTATPDEVV